METWTCPNCLSVNSTSVTNCKSCGFKNTELILHHPEPISSEESLALIAKVIKGIGIFFAIISLVIGIILVNDYEEEIGTTLLIGTIPIFLFAITTSTLLKVICNISNNLKEINKKLK